MPLFDHSIGARAEICKKKPIGILVQMMTPKGHFKLTDLYEDKHIYTILELKFQKL